MSLIEYMSQKILTLEKRVLKKMKLQPIFQRLTTMPGIGLILGMTIALETGDIGRFASAADYTSYCRCVKAEKKSNQKKKGQNNRKNGNKYLCWAFIEAIHHGKRVCTKLNSYYQKKANKTKNEALAAKSSAAKYSKAAFYIMRDQADFDLKKMFG